MLTSFPRKIGKIEKEYIFNKEIHNFRNANMQPSWIYAIQAATISLKAAKPNSSEKN